MTKYDSRLEARTVIVAGGAGEVGEGIVRALLARGATVVVPSRSREKLDALARSVTPDAARLVPVEADVASDAGRTRVRAASLAHPPLAGVVLSLGGFWQGPPVLEIDTGAILQTLAPRVLVPLALLQALRPLFLGPQTTILQINALAATTPLPGLSALHIASAAELALTRALLTDARAEDPRVVSLLIDTWVRTRSRPDLGRDALSLEQVGEAVASQLASPGAEAILRLNVREGEVTLVPLAADGGPRNSAAVLDAVPAFDRAARASRPT